MQIFQQFSENSFSFFFLFFFFFLFSVFHRYSTSYLDKIVEESSQNLHIPVLLVLSYQRCPAQLNTSYFRLLLQYTR